MLVIHVQAVAKQSIYYEHWPVRSHLPFTSSLSAFYPSNFQTIIISNDLFAASEASALEETHLEKQNSGTI